MISSLVYAGQGGCFRRPPYPSYPEPARVRAAYLPRPVHGGLCSGLWVIFPIFRHLLPAFCLSGTPRACRFSASCLSDTSGLVPVLYSRKNPKKTGLQNRPSVKAPCVLYFLPLRQAVPDSYTVGERRPLAPHGSLHCRDK